MCGIFAVSAVHDQKSGQDQAGLRVLRGLQRLEYRGYDSWGVGVLGEKGLELEKRTGKIGGVVSLSLPPALLALGHTRWATHGGVTSTNTHPHWASDGSFLLVQNGVVENYQQLKAQLETEGYVFKTQTDTEVIVGLLEKVRRESGDDQLELSHLLQVSELLEGRSTVVVLTADGRFLAFRLGSPLVVARNQRGEVFVSSDVVSVAAEADTFYALANGELLEIQGHDVIVTNASLETLDQVVFQPIDVTATNVDKEGYQHFMLKEIFEQPRVLHQVFPEDLVPLKNLAKAVKQATQVYFVGVGSAALIAGSLAESFRQAGISATELRSNQADSFLPFMGPKALCIAVSQSGETADTLEFVEKCQERGAKIGSIVNMNGSTLTTLSDLPCMLGVGPEIGVASTKALTGQLAWGSCLLDVVQGIDPVKTRQRLKRAEKQLQDWFDEVETMSRFQSLAGELEPTQHIFVLGRGQLYYSALEFALKMKEISYIHTEGFSGGELKHGPLALIEPDTPVVCLVAEDDQKADMLSAAAEVKARGARVIGVSTTPNEIFDVWLPVPDLSAMRLTQIPMVIVPQVVSYYIALEKGHDPDTPRNLAKSVTVK